MNQLVQPATPERRDGDSPALEACIAAISEKCVECGQCVQECAFLQHYGTPKRIVADKRRFQTMAFECSLCRLCEAVCPAGVNIADFFQKSRAEALRGGNGLFARHKRILGYEKRGMSRRYSYYAFPKGCDTILFPGCALPGSRPAVTWRLFEELRKAAPNLGIVLDCCAKPSHDLGREAFFHAMFGEMKSFLLSNGIKHVLVACPSCYQVFNRYGGQLSVRMVYDLLARANTYGSPVLGATVSIHDPCAVRDSDAVHDAVRDLCTGMGLEIEEMPHCRNKALCCGEGGAVSRIRPEFAKKWGELRRSEANGNPIVTYCAGCADLLRSDTPIIHLLDLVFRPETAIAGKSVASRAPWTYLNRIRLKKRFAGLLSVPVSRERTFHCEPKEP